MKKLITLLVTIAMIGVMLTGCGGSGKEVTADPAKLAEDLSKTASGDTLSSISEDILASTYLVDTSKIDSCAAYRCYCMRSCCHQMQRQLLCFRSKRTF